MEPWIRAGEGCPCWSQAGLPAPACRHLGKLQAARFRHLAVASPGSEIWHFLCELCGYTSINYMNYMHIECTCYTCVLYVYIYIYTCMCVYMFMHTDTHTHEISIKSYPSIQKLHFPLRFCCAQLTLFASLAGCHFPDLSRTLRQLPWCSSWAAGLVSLGCVPAADGWDVMAPSGYFTQRTSSCLAVKW